MERRPTPREFPGSTVARCPRAVHHATGRLDPNRRLLSMRSLRRSLALLLSASLLVSLAGACASPTSPTSSGAPAAPAATASGQSAAAAGTPAAGVPPARESV